MSVATRTRSGAEWSAPPLRGFADGFVDELTRGIVLADAEGLVVLTFPRNMCARFGFVA